MTDPKPGEYYHFSRRRHWVRVLFIMAGRVYYEFPGAKATSDCTLEEFKFMYEPEDQP